MKKLIVLGIVVAVGACGFWLARPAYRNWKQHRAITQARESLRQDDLRSAALSARQALQVNPGNLEACRILAQITESLRLPNAIEWRQRVVELAPNAVTNRLDLARCGILQGNYAVAAKALQGVAKSNQNTVAFHQLAALVAMGLNNIALCERHFSEAVKLEPANKLLQLNQAVIHLQARDQQVVAGALQTLEQLYGDAAYRQDALRHLAMASSRNQDFAKASVFTRELQADPKASFDDRLMHLNVLKQASHADFGAYLTELEGQSVKAPQQVNILTGWLLSNAMADEAGRWLASLPANVQTNQSVMLARSDCYMAQKDWTGLQAHLQDAQWETLDFMRLALLARAYRGQRQDITGQTQWRAAVRAASEKPKQLAALARMADQWTWDREKEEVLWMIIERFPAERWALRSLNQFYLAEGNTRGLYKVYGKAVDYDASDIAARNNLAAVSFLLNQQTNKAHELAREAWLKATNNVAFASTYAWSLHLQGRTADGLKVLGAFQADRLKTPGVALYYGAMESAVNDSAKAKEYLDLAASGQLLPEEKTLLAAARSGALRPK